MDFNRYYICNKLYLIFFISFILFIIKYNNNFFINHTNVPELTVYNNQILQFLNPSKQCPLSLYINRKFNDNNISNEIKKINLRDKNLFITFFGDDDNFPQHLKFLEKKGLIKTNYSFAESNIYISPLEKDFTNPNRNNDYNLNKYQKVYRFLINIF